MKYQFSGKEFTLGILGGGQLGRMLLQRAIDYNISAAVLDPDANAPCKHLCDRFVHGKFSDFDTVYSFGKTVSLLTIEIEHVNTEALKKLESEGLPVFPQPHILEMVKDKGLQKQFYREHQIPTAPFMLAANKTQIKRTDYPYILKSRTGGYDGKGVVKINNSADLENAFEGPYVVEECIPFTKEIAVIVSRNSDGITSVFPSCEMMFNPEANLVELLFSPSAISQELENKARHIALDLISQLGLTGILAVEMFVTSDDEILVNEIAPRPHNSGHHTIEANITSQYEQHLRSILNLPPGDTSLRTAAAMVNILGEKGYSGEAVYDGLEDVLAMKGTHIHLYGKKETRPFRKMGHVTVTSDDTVQATETARKVMQTLKAKSQ